uniref:Uncharacterized protein n=1 Tax=Panagrolaimus davidi TaxID=227884 RepID=A0A914QC61_9BILA
MKNVSLTFGASLGVDKNICNETNNDSNSGQYIKSPWGFHYEYDVTKDQIEIVKKVAVFYKLDSKLRAQKQAYKHLVSTVSLTFGAALDADKNICKETSNNTNSGQYIKSPWGFHYEYDVTKGPTEIVRCCKGNFCNHFGMFDSESAFAWPKKFQYKMNKDW